MKRSGLKYLLFACVAVFLFYGCSVQQKIKRASNKIYKLQMQYPVLNEVDTLEREVKLKSKGSVKEFSVGDLGFDWIGAINKLKKDNVDPDDPEDEPVISVIEKDGGGSVLRIECPPQEIDTIVEYECERIVAECSCKYEINEATKQLKKDKRRLMMGLLGSFLFMGLLIAFGLKKRKQ